MCGRPFLYSALFACSLGYSCRREKSIFFCCQKKVDKKKTSQERRRSRHLSQLPVGKAGLLSCNHYIRKNANRWPSVPSLANLAVHFALSKICRGYLHSRQWVRPELLAVYHQSKSYYLAAQPSEAVVARRSKTTKRLSRADASARRCSAVRRSDSTGAILVLTI